MSEARDRLEAEAEGLYPSRAAYHEPWEEAREAHVRAKTVSAEQVEVMTEARLINRGYNNRHSIPSHTFDYEVKETVAGLRAAGFLIEGDDDVR